MMRGFVNWNIRMSRGFDHLFFRSFTCDGNTEFNDIVPALVEDGSQVADVGGGKTPFFSPDQVIARRLRVTGVDIDAEQLMAAPQGAYSTVIVSALERCEGAPHDYVVAQSVLEHVSNGRDAMAGIGRLLRPGGKVFTFCPNKRAWFARLNKLLPERLKRAILFSIYPSKAERQGFPAHYSGCTPAEMRFNMMIAGIRPLGVRYYFISSYFMFCFPLYVFWRISTFPLMKFWPDRYCETFIMCGIRDGLGVESFPQ